MHKNPALVRGWTDALVLSQCDGMSATIPETLRSFYVENRQQLYTYAVALTGQREAAEDAVHQAFQRLLRRDSLPEDLRPYVFRCVRNAALDQHRRAGVREDSPFDETDGTGAVPPTDLIESRELVARLRALPSDERETIMLKIYDQFTFREIAALRGVPLPTVASWYRRGLERLRETLNRENR